MRKICYLKQSIIQTVLLKSEMTKAIMHSEEFLLFSGTDVWMKRDGDKDLDITMGSFDGAQICEVVVFIFCINWVIYFKRDLNN